MCGMLEDTLVDPRIFVSEDLLVKIKQQHDELFVSAKAARSSSE